MKHLRNLPHYVLDQMVMAHASNERGSGTQEKGSQPPTQQQPRAQQPARQSPVTKSPPQPPGPLLRSERETSPDFDDDDDALLEKWVKAKVGSGERWNNISIYQELSNKVRAMLLSHASAMFYVHGSMFYSWCLSNRIPAISSLRPILEASFCNLVARRTYRHEELGLRARACLSAYHFTIVKEK